MYRNKIHEGRCRATSDEEEPPAQPVVPVSDQEPKLINMEVVQNLCSTNQSHFLDSASTDPFYMDEHWRRSPWLGALILGIIKGTVSMSSLMLGFGAVKNDPQAVVISGFGGLVAAAIVMAMGEFVSVFSLRDTELAGLEKETQEYAKGPEAQARELEELTRRNSGIARGLPSNLPKQVVVDVLKAHARNEPGIDAASHSNRLKAAFASSLAFPVGGAFPLLAGKGVFIQSLKIRIALVVAVSSFALVAFGATGARLGGAPIWKAVLRLLMGGWLVMGLTYGIFWVLNNSYE